MCGRFCNATTPDAVTATFKVNFASMGHHTAHNSVNNNIGIRGHNAAPQWNIAPTAEIETITPAEAAEKNHLTQMRWGIATPQNTRPLINARSETMFEKPTFRVAAHERRCLVVASGWYEWAGPKKPYYITRSDDAPMGMAGLYWQHGDERYCVIVTTAADGVLADIHHRAPLVLDGYAAMAWLNPLSARGQLGEVIAPTSASVFRWHAVSAEVGSTRVSHEGLIAHDPYHGAQPEPQLTLF